jgi:hypothetical protein
MRISKLQASVAQFASTSEIRPELSCIHHNGITTVATDSFRLVEIKYVGAAATYFDKPQLYRAKDIIRAKVKTSGDIDAKRNLTTTDKGAITATYLEDRGVTADQYPKYESLFENESLADKNVIEIKINGAYLASVALALSKLNDFGKITLRIPKGDSIGTRFIEMRATGQDHEARALVAPCVK